MGEAVGDGGGSPRSAPRERQLHPPVGEDAAQRVGAVSETTPSNVTPVGLNGTQSLLTVMLISLVI